MWNLKKQQCCERCVPRGKLETGQLFLITKIDSLSLPRRYLNKWEEQPEVPWGHSVALYPCTLKAECRSNPLFCLPTVCQVKTCCKLKSSRRRLYCFTSFPSSQQGKVGVKVQCSQTMPIPQS